MRLRGRTMLALLALVALPLALLAGTAGALLRQLAGAILQSDGGDAGLDPDQLWAAAKAAERVLWLAAGAIAAVAMAAGLLLARRSVLEPLERLGRRLGIRGEAADASSSRRRGDEWTAIVDRIDTLTQTVARDALERESQLDAVRATLDRAGDQLVDAQRMGITGRLALGAAHEIGGPLSIAIATVDALRAGADPAGLDVALEEALLRVDAILRELTRFGRPDEAEAIEVIELTTLAEDVLTLARLHPRVRKTQIALHRPPQGAAPVCVRAHRRQLEQVLLNLVVNAADATAARTRVEAPGRIDLHIVESLDDEGRGIGLLLVDDDGPGVPDHLRDRIFEPFFTSKAADHGTGLGLAISRRLVQAAGGTLTVDRSPDNGARFAVSLPLAKDEPTSRRRSRWMLSAAAGLDADGPRHAADDGAVPGDAADGATALAAETT